MSSAAKRRGYAVEIQVRDKHIQNGIACERVPLSGLMGGKYSGDLCIPRVEQPDFTCEVKARRSGAGFSVISRWIEGRDILFVKQNHQDPLVIMNWDMYIKLIKKYYGINETS